MDETGNLSEKTGDAAGATDSEAAFLEQAIDDWGDTVLRLAASRLGNRADAEDVFQTVFLRLIQSPRNFKESEHLKAWLLHVTVNCCNDVHRSPWRARRAAFEESALSADSERGTDAAVSRMEGSPDGPERPERFDELDAALARLTPKQRTAVHLFYYEGYATDEIAQITGERPATVRSHLHRARGTLRIELGAAS